MRKSQLRIALFLVLCVVILSEMVTVHASSESFPLVESASVSRDVFANEGELLVGNFTISNIPTWTDPSTGTPQTVVYEFKITEIGGPANCPHETELYGAYLEENASFDLYCNYTGIYRLRFNVGSGNPTTGIGNMSATLNYDVVSSSSVDLLNETPSPANPTVEPSQLASPHVIKEQAPNYFLILKIDSVLVTLAAAALIALFYFRKRR